jgi:hypothetical protein
MEDHSEDGAPKTPEPKPKADQSVVQLAYARLMSSALPPQKPGQKPSFDIGTVTRAEVAKEIRAKISENPTIFNMGGMAVDVQAEKIDAFLDKDRKVHATLAQPWPMNPDSATPHIERVANWFRVNADGAQIPKPIPDWIRTLLIRTGIGEFPPLKGLIRHPVIMGDKLVLKAAGYDPVSAFWMHFDEPKVSPGIKTATHKEILEFLLETWLGEVDFKDEADAVRALMLPATMLHAKTQLRAAGKWPAFLISAPDLGTGKTELARALIEAITGDSQGDTPWQDDDTAMGKLMLSLCRADVDAILWDNIQSGSTIDSRHFNTVITSLIVMDRILGQSQTIKTPSQAQHILTGNNITLAPEIFSRTVESRLMAKTEGQKTFNRVAFRQWTKANRGTIIVGLSRLLLEVKHDLPNVGRFNLWHQLVAGPLMQASGQKGALNHWNKRPSTFENERLAAFLHAVRKAATNHFHHPEKPMTTQDLVDHVRDEVFAFLDTPVAVMVDVTAQVPPGASDEDRKVIEATRKRAKDKVKISLAAALTRNRDKMADGLRLILGSGQNDKSQPVKTMWTEEVAK